MKKRIIIIISCIVFLAAMPFVIRKIVAGNSDKGTLSTVENDIILLSQKYPTKILVYGEKLDFDEKITVENIFEITYDTMKKTGNYAYQLIIINDLNGKSVLSQEEWKIIDDVVKTDADINFLYLGDKQFEKIIEAGIVEEDITAFEDGDLSLGLFHEGKRAVCVYGTYTSLYGTDRNRICELIMREQAFSIEMGNQ